MKKLFAAANRRPVCYLRRMIAGIALLLGMVPAHAQFFGPVAVYSGGAGTASSGLAVGDLNGDGSPDVVLTNNDLNTVGVLLGNGSGSLGTVTTYGTGAGSTPNWVALGDLNADGKPDVITANYGSNTVGVLLGTGTGAFGAATTYGTGTSSPPRTVTLGDVNNDGKQDVLTADNGSNVIGVLLGTGTGSLGAVTTVSLGVGSVPRGIALMDVNADGFLDIVSPNTGSNDVGVLRGTGTGTFGPMTAYSIGTGVGPRGMTLADLNADGKSDVVLANSVTNTVDFLLNSGTGTFGAVTSYGIGAGTNPQSVAVGDINGDGNPDLVTANPTNRTVSVLLGTGPGTFGSAMAYSTGSGSLPNEVRLADLNGDGRLDIVTNNGSSNVGVLLNQPVLASITSFAPTTSRVGGTVTVTGTGLGSATGITVNGVAGTIVGTPTATSLTFVVGPGSSTGLIRVTTGSGPAVSSTSLIIVPAPVLTGSSPPSGATGTVLNVTGLDLQNISSVTFTGVGGTFTAAAGYVVDATGTQLTGLVVPSGLQPGNATFTVTTTGGVSNALNFLVTSAPVITSLSPTSGSVGTSVTITGTNLSGATSVRFNGILVPSASFTSNLATTIVVNVPAGTTTGLVTVTTPAGTSNGLLFTIAAPQLAVMQGSILYPNGGTGYNFGVQAVNTTSTAVGFALNNAGTAAVTISSITTTGDFAMSGAVPTSVAAGGAAPIVVTFTPTAAGPRTGTVVITSSLGIYILNLSGNGLVAAAPVITTLSPNTGTVGGSITIMGTNLGGVTSVSFNGGTALLIANNTSTSLTVVVPAGTITGPVTVTTPAGTSNGLLFTIAAPQLTVMQGSTFYPSGGTGYNFGIQAVSNASAAVSFTLNNPGTAALTISGITTTGDFAVSGTVPTSVAAGGTAPVAVTFTPTATGTRTGTLVITSSLGTYTVNLNGNGQVGAPTLISLSPASGLAGSTLALTGTNLTGTTAVYFLRGVSTPVTSGYTVVSAGSITGVVVPVGLGSGTYTVYVGTPGGSSNALIFTVTAPAPILSSLAPTSGAVGDIITLTGSNLAGATSVSFNGVSQPVIIANTGNTLQVVVPPGASTGLVTVTTPGGTSAGLPFTLLVDLTISTGTTATPVVIAANTYRNILITPTGVASLGTGVSVAGGLTVQANGILYTACEAVTGTGSFLLQDGATLGICDVNGLQATGNSGAVRVTGGRFFSTAASYVYNGTAAQSTGSGLPATVRSFTTTNNSLVTLTQPVSISQTLTVAGSGNLDLNGQALRLLSDANGTALVVNAGTGIVTGNAASMERYIMPAGGFLGPGYHHYSAPVTGCTVANLATPGFTPVVNAAFNTSANPLYVAPFPAVFGYDQGRLSTTTNNLDLFSKGWVSPLAPSAVLTVGQGYSVHLPATAKVTFTGTLNTGTYNYTLLRDLSPAVTAEAGWQLLGNPYPAPLDYSLLNAADRSNLDAAIYVYAATNSYAGNYLTYVNGMGSVNPLLAAGQGFFARVSAGFSSGTLRFRNAHRVTSFATQVLFQRGAADTRPRLRLTLQAATGPGPADDLYLYTEAGATAARDAEYDAVKLPNPTGLNLSANATTGEALAIDGLPVLGTGGTVVPLTLGLPTAGQYVLAVGELLHFAPGTVITLHDGLTGTATPLTTATSYAFSSATTVVAGRFWLGLRPAATPLATSAELRAEAVAVFPNPAARQATVLVPGVAGAATLHLKLLNALGQVVQTQNAPLPASGALLPLDVAGLARGVYTLRLVAGAASVTRKLVLE